jgi:hypothetical protein
MSSLSFDECERNTSRRLPSVEISRAKHSSVRKIFAQEIKAVPVAAQRANKGPPDLGPDATSLVGARAAGACARREVVWLMLSSRDLHSRVAGLEALSYCWSAFLLIGLTRIKHATLIVSTDADQVIVACAGSADPGSAGDRLREWGA